MKISNYATSKVEEMRRNNDEIEINREDQKIAEDCENKKVVRKRKYKTSPGRMISSIGYRGEE